MRVMVYAISFILAAVSAVAEEQSKPQSGHEYEVYKAVGVLGTQMFYEVYKNENINIRTYALLLGCSQKGLANAVRAKRKDPTFETVLRNMIEADRFHGLPPYAVLSAQNAANAMLVGYELGYGDALSLVGSNGKADACAAAVKIADDILK
jgi:hypothetical protein